MQSISVKIRLYPSKSQVRELSDTLEICRGVYNSLLNDRNFQYDTEKKTPSHFDQNKTVTLWRRERDELKMVYSQVFQDVCKRVDLAYKAFFRRVKSGEKPGFPRYKGEGYDSFTFPQNGFKIGDSTISISLCGHQQKIQAKIKRDLSGFNIKTLCIRRQNGKWFACLSCEFEPNPLPPSTETIGIDVGIKVFAALSDGTFIANPKFFRKDEKALAKAQRKLSAQTRRTKAYRKAKKVVACINERIRNRRNDFIHQESRKIVNRYGVIALEKLNVKGMVKNHCLSKSISDASWSMFRDKLTYKAEWAGRQVITVNPRNTSQMCSGCQTIVPKKLSDRVHYCPNCGLRLDRDTNAAINILRLGMQSLGA